MSLSIPLPSKLYAAHTAVVSTTYRVSWRPPLSPSLRKARCQLPICIASTRTYKRTIYYTLYAAQAKLDPEAKEACYQLDKARMQAVVKEAKAVRLMCGIHLAGGESHVRLVFNTILKSVTPNRPENEMKRV